MRISVSDWGLVQSVGGEVVVGKAFAFFARDAFKKSQLSWIGKLLGTEPAARVISLFGSEPVGLPGATLEPATIPALSLANVTSDKALYREGRDEVHLLALDPLAPEAAVTLEISLSGADFAKHPVTLDGRGAAAITLRDLPPGDYEARFRGQPKSAPACSFTVAAYRLAPLVASLADRRLDGQRLAVTLRLESFGNPVNGAVQLDLTDRGSRIARVSAEARDGIVEASFTLTGEGPHAINAQLAADPSRTATVPIVGSRAAERSLTTFSTLGYEVKGSLLPSEGATPLRGIYLTEGALRTTPFRLDRIDTRRARLTAMVAVDSARVVVIDPSFPRKRAGSVNPDDAPHPGSYDDLYQRGESLFQKGKFAEARAAFEAAIARASLPHPNYAYYMACCFSREGDKDRAILWLYAAIRDGWKDFALLQRDDDLAALRGDPRYEAIPARGLREIALDAVPAGKVIEIDLPEPAAILAIGAFAGGDPWEGWAATIAPSAVAPKITVPERATPGGEARIEIETGADGGASVYLVVKDARLLTPDTPASRLAGGLKALAEDASQALGIGKPTQTLAQMAPHPSPPPMVPPFASFGAPPGAAGLIYRGSMPVPSAAPVQGFGGAPPTMAAEASPMTDGGFGPPPTLAAPSPRATGAPKSAAAPAPPKGGAAGPYRAPAMPPPPSIEEPLGLFAGLVETSGGRASVSLRLGPDFADYVVEAFVAAGLDWAPVEARFRAEKEVFASLDLPAFVHPADGAIARLHVGSRAGASVHVIRDGAPVALLLDGRPLAIGETIPAGRAEISFLAGPGDYEATVEDGSGVTERVVRRVEAPGKLRSLTRSVRFLSPGESLSRDSDASILALRVLPGLDKPFTALVDATADYGHACCEQTAAKMLSACAMYALSGADRRRRDKAESIIVAGVRREQSMWLRGRGFKMYPESSSQPDSYWGPKAARYLWNLSLLRDLPDSPGRALGAAVEEGLAMADDATRAYGLEWPPRRLSTCEEAYAAHRFGKANGAALATVQRLTSGDSFLQPVNGAVQMRTEAAYGAATLLRAGGAADRQRALALANAVVKALGPNGRLYSTVDSVAAIALMAELGAAKVVGGAGKVEIDGTVMPTAQALDRSGEIRSIRAVEGVAAVEVTRTVEEDWDAFNAGLPLAVRLFKNGSTVTRRFEALDAVDLEVTLEGGYKPGDLLWVCLPDALSRVVGGGQVKRFSVDFEGKNSVRVSLAATAATVGLLGDPAPARFAVCVRNMFEEERGGNPGPIEVTVAPPAGSSVLGKVLSGLKGLFGG